MPIIYRALEKDSLWLKNRENQAPAYFQAKSDPAVNVLLANKLLIYVECFIADTANN